MNILNDNTKNDWHTKKKKRKQEHFSVGSNILCEPNDYYSIPVDDNFKNVAKPVVWNEENADNNLLDNSSYIRKKKKEKKKDILIESVNVKQASDLISIKDHTITKVNDNNDFYTVGRSKIRKRKTSSSDNHNELNDGNASTAHESNKVTKKREPNMQVSLCGKEKLLGKKEKKVIIVDDVDSGNVIDVDKVTDDDLISIDSDQLDCPNAGISDDCFSLLHHIHGTSDRNCLDALEKEGIVSQKGKWNTSEIHQLENNLKDFLKLYPVKKFSRLIIPRTKEDKTFRKETQFILHMCQGIQRVRYHVEQRVITQFSNFLLKGKFSANEKKKLMELQNLYGNSWKEIGYLMNRNYQSLHTYYTHTVTSKRNGKWTKEEDDKLIKAVNTYLQRSENISWTNVSRAVGTRSHVFCRYRWVSKYIKQSKANNCESITFKNNLSDDYDSITFHNNDILKLLSIIFETNVDDEYLIDWNDISKQFSITVTPSWLKWKFGVICKEVYHHYILEFGELVEQLYEIYQKKVSNENNAGPNIVEECVSVNEEFNYNGPILVEGDIHDNEVIIID